MPLPYSGPSGQFGYGGPITGGASGSIGGIDLNFSLNGGNSQPTPPAPAPAPVPAPPANNDMLATLQKIAVPAAIGAGLLFAVRK